MSTPIWEQSTEARVAAAQMRWAAEFLALKGRPPRQGRSPR